MANLYSIAHWDELYETPETRKLLRLKWVPTPNKHDGLGFRRMVNQSDRSDLFAAWNLILQVASKGQRDRERGKLMRNGAVLSAGDLSLMTGFPEKVFMRALTFFSREIGWLVSSGNGESAENPASSAEIPADAAENPASSPAEGRNEGKNTRNRVGANESRPAAVNVSDEDWRKGIAAEPAYAHINVTDEFGKLLRWCEVHRKQPTRRRFIAWLNRIEKPLRSFSGTRKTKPVPVSGPAEPDWTPEQISDNKRKCDALGASLREHLRGPAPMEATA